MIKKTMLVLPIAICAITYNGFGQNQSFPGTVTIGPPDLHPREH